MEIVTALRRIALPFAVLGLLVGTSVPPAAVHATGGNEPKTSAIRITPPAPVFDEKARLAELAQRRARVAKSIGSRAVLILFSAEPRVYTNEKRFLMCV